MTARLKAYIRRTILAAAREYAHPAKRRTKDSTVSAFRDYAHGTDTGCWNDLIYTVDVLNMFNRYRSDVASAIADYLSETGESADSKVVRNDDVTYADMLIACAKRKRMTFEMYSNNDKDAYSAQLAIRFACEYLLSEVASDCGVEL
jgi:hypothetical protein